jgi:hypothetical protein
MKLKSAITYFEINGTDPLVDAKRFGRIQKTLHDKGIVVDDYTEIVETFQDGLINLAIAEGFDVSRFENRIEFFNFLVEIYFPSNGKEEPEKVENDGIIRSNAFRKFKQKHNQDDASEDTVIELVAKLTNEMIDLEFYSKLEITTIIEILNTKKKLEDKRKRKF